jgi:quercetin dioxygenase-like cupin family protein
VERGLSSPSILSIDAICKTLEIPLSDLISYGNSKNDSLLAASASEISKANQRPNIQMSSGSIKYQFLSGDFRGRQFEILIGEIPPNYNYPPAAHEGEEFGYVLYGTFVFKVREESHELSPGDSYHFLATTPHGYETAGGAAKVLWVQTLKYDGWRRAAGHSHLAKRRKQSIGSRYDIPRATRHYESAETQ